MKAEREQCGAAAMSHPTEIADADESRWQHVHESIEGCAISQGDQSVIGNGHTMGVLAEIP